MGETISLASEVWICTALLHYENPDRQEFSVLEIKNRVIEENITGKVRPEINWYINVHCVANVPPDPHPYRMLYGTRAGFRRLWKAGDDFDPGRGEGKTQPDAGEIPSRYAYLLDWYREWAGR